MINAEHLPAADLTIVEPRLSSASGHFHSLVSSICEQLPSANIRVACAPGGAEFLPAHCEAWPQLRPRLSKIGLAIALRRLGASTSSLCLLTACDRSLAVATAMLPKACRVSGIVHDVGWLKRRYLVRVASQLRPDLRVACFGSPVRELARAAGISVVEQFSYPVDPIWTNGYDQPDSPSHFLMAGGPRSEKGFLDVARWSIDSIGIRQLPVTIHLSKPDADCRSAIRELEERNSADIRLHQQPRTPSEFRDDFRGAIVLLLHRAAQYEGRASGLFLDAIMAGAPIIALAGSSFAAEVDKEGIGVVAASTDSSALRDAAQRAVAGWQQQVEAMRRRRSRLLATQSAKPLATFVMGG